MAKHITRRSAGRRDNRIIHPQRDWLIGLMATTMLFLAGSVYAGFVFFTELHHEVDPSTVSVETTSYRYDLIQEVLGTYTDRAETFEALRAEEPISTSTQNMITENAEEGEGESEDPALATTTDIRVE